MQIQKTTDYEQFTQIAGNRQINPTHLKHLSASIARMNLLDVNPIIVTEDYKIIDGQHRFEVARKNNLPIHYIMVDRDTSLEEIQLLNANNKAWNMEDYLNSYIELGNHDYEILKDFSTTYGLSISISMSLLTYGEQDTTASDRRGPLIQRFKEGKFEVKRLKDAIELANRLNEVKPFVKGTIWKDRSFLRALQKAFKQVGTKRLLERISAGKGKITRQINMKEYLRELEEIYNHQLKEENKVRFF